MRDGWKNAAANIGAALFWIAVWWAAAALTGQELLLPSPGAAFTRLLALSADAGFWLTCGASLLRIAAGTAAAVLCGTLTAFLCAAVKTADRLIAPAVTVVRATPVASFIILAMLWIGKSLLPSFIAFLMVFPIIFTNVRTGLLQIPPELTKMARVFALPRLTVLRRITLPSVAPFFVSGTRSSLGLGWKAGIAAEVLAFSPDSIGRKLAESKNYLETADLFAWTAVVVLLSLIIELAFTRLIAAAGKKIAGDRKLV